MNDLKMHVDDFVAHSQSPDYASWILMHFRLPAVMQAKFRDIMKDRKLFCSRAGHRYRVIGASRMGDIWLTKDFSRDAGYDERVDIADCTNFGDQP